MPSTTRPDGAVIRYEVDRVGEDRWLTLLHGGLVASDTWRLQRPDLDLGIQHCNLITVDLRGQGESTVGDGDLTIERAAGDVLAVWDELGIEAGTVCGFSMGGMVALELVRLAPERVDGIIIESSPFGLGDDERDAFRQRADRTRTSGITDDDVQQLVDRALSEPFRERQPEIARRYENAIAARDPQSLAAVFDAIAAWRYEGPTGDELPPALLVFGAIDHAVGRPHAERLSKLLAKAELVELPDTGHTVHLENALAFNHLVGQFMLHRLEQPLYDDFS